MKTRISYLIMLGMFISSVALGQSRLKVLPGTSKNFWVNTANSVALRPITPFTWTSTGAGIVTFTSTDSSANATFSATVGDSARIDVYATSNTGCDGDTSSIKVIVVASLDYGATFASASQNVCPANNHGGTGDAAPVTINFTGGNVSSFSYTLDGVNFTVTLAVPTATYLLNVTTAYTIADAGAHPIRITSITGALGTSIIPAGTEPTHTINVGAAPAISNIKF